MFTGEERIVPTSTDVDETLMLECVSEYTAEAPTELVVTDTAKVPAEVEDDLLEN